MFHCAVENFYEMILCLEILNGNRVPNELTKYVANFIQKTHITRAWVLLVDLDAWRQAVNQSCVLKLPQFIREGASVWSFVNKTRLLPVPQLTRTYLIKTWV